MDGFRAALQDPWVFLVVGYLGTITIETPVLVAGLSAEHSLRRRLAAGAWLTACTYPVVVLVLPALFDPATQRPAYLAVAELFAAAAECVLFALAFGPLRHRWRDLAVVSLANLASFGVGELLVRLVLVAPP